MLVEGQKQTSWTKNNGVWAQAGGIVPHCRGAVAGAEAVFSIDVDELPRDLNRSSKLSNPAPAALSNEMS